MKEVVDGLEALSGQSAEVGRSPIGIDCWS